MMEDNKMMDEEDGQNQHSLPSPEEVKTDAPQRSKDTHPLLILLIAVLFGVMVIGLGFGLTADNRRDNGNSATALDTAEAAAAKKKLRTNTIRNWLLDNEISKAATFNDPTSPQNKALTFLAAEDKMELDTPSGGMMTAEGYTFLTRYVMTLFYFSTNGAQWNYNLLFLSDNHVCDWFFIFTPPVGQVGVLCHPTDRQIIGFSFSKFILLCFGGSNTCNCMIIRWYSSLGLNHHHLPHSLTLATIFFFASSSSISQQQLGRNASFRIGSSYDHDVH